jgi:sugar O-acyltransferase (sialic acid O-acetyltransferase NeuD family)
LKNKIIIIGGGGHAKVVICLLRKIVGYDILGYTDNDDKGEILNVKYLGNDNILSDIKKKYINCSAVIGVGMININPEREKIFNRLKKLKYKLPTLISPDCSINEEVTFGESSIVLDGVVINTGSNIGKGCIINTNSTIEHDCKIGDFSQICPGATLSGGVRIGRHCLIGTGANVKQYLNITDYCVIGIGAAVVNDCKQSGIYTGVPARRNS